MKILHIIKSLGRGGAEMLLPETLQLHDTNTFEFHYAYFLPWKDQMVESIRLQGGIVHCFNANNNIQLMAKLWDVTRYVRDNKIQLIHAHLPWAGILSRIVGKICKVPVVYTEHNKQERYHWATRFMNILTLNQLTRVIAVSDDVAYSIRKHKRVLRAPLTTIVNGVNTDHFDPVKVNDKHVRSHLDIPIDAPVIGTVAVFRSQKRLDLWMGLAATVLAVNSKAHFIIVGDGPFKETLWNIRDSLGPIGKRIHMPGLQTEVRPYLATFDIYLMTSIFEGLPIALLEAMSMECAIVSTDAGGVKELIRNKVDGLLCPVNEPETLTPLLMSLIGNESLRKTLGVNARKRVQTSFNMKEMVVKLESVYTKAFQR